ncbi:MAG: FtsX-like permease family protein [Gammaproteobacteria bacterium]
MRALDRKMWRDLWHLKGQALAIALVIASGVATFVMFLATLDSLQATRGDFYRNYRFAQVFAPLKRAPESLRRRIEAIPGVDHVDTRVVAPVTIDIPGFAEPVNGVITSVPDRGEPALNRLYIKSGRNVQAGRNDEVVVSEAFAAAQHLRPGDHVAVIIKGRRKTLDIVGTAVSPEFIHQVRPGGVFPDYERYGVMWMARKPLGSAYDMEDAFNNVALSISRGAHPQDVIDRLDGLLAPYGGAGAYGRKDQPSNRFLSQELVQLRNSSVIFPFIFLGVAAFLFNVVIARLVSTQREQIASLKAFGYSNLDVGLHYLKLVMVIVLFAAALGLGVGAWLTGKMAAIYMDFFRLPYLEYRLPPAVVAGAVLVSAAAGVLGTFFAVRGAARLRPAEAMRPESPALYRETLVERAGLKRALSGPARMILRHLGHRPVKSALTVIGIGFAVAILMTGRFQEDTITFMMHVHYGLSQREDLSVTFVEPTSRRVLNDLRSLPGVEYGEVFRAVPVRLRFGHRSERTMVMGAESGGELQRLLDTDLRTVELPADGLLLTDYLGKMLHAKVGDRVTLEALEGSRPVRRVPVVGLIKQYLGVRGYMNLGALNRLMGEGSAVSGAYLSIDPHYAGEIYRRLKQMPRVAGTAVREQEIRNFRKTMRETMLFWSSLATAFAAVIAFGVVYNSARITLTERSRELASLRVLGFTRGEISYILLGELGLLTLLAIPPGLLLGRGLCGYIAAMAESDLYRVPLILETDTYAFAAAMVLLAAAISALVVRRRLDRLDLIGVLKTRE